MADCMQQLLVFNVLGSKCALDLQDIAEVLDPPALFPVPWAPDIIRGAMNFHGSLVSVLDLAEFMKLGTAHPEGVVLVLDRRIANLALMADSVENIVPADTILETEESDDPMVEKVLMMADGEIRLLALGQVLANIESCLRG
jgi:purine-binding chemotaxis protein CheW